MSQTTLTSDLLLERLNLCKSLVANAAAHLLDPQGRDLAARIQWWQLPGMEAEWPVAVFGAGPPVLLLHGFDSSFLEFRRLAPLLAPHCQLFIPDLYGFGFCPRPAPPAANPKAVLRHLDSLVAAIGERTPGPLGLIGASMGGSVAVELARRCPGRIDRLLLLAPAGLTGKPMPLPPPARWFGGEVSCPARGTQRSLPFGLRQPRPGRGRG